VRRGVLNSTYLSTMEKISTSECPYGSGCSHFNVPEHRRYYSHPHGTVEQERKWNNLKCRNGTGKRGVPLFIDPAFCQPNTLLPVKQVGSSEVPGASEVASEVPVSSKQATMMAIFAMPISDAEKIKLMMALNSSF
jgi:hypothetical protein